MPQRKFGQFCFKVWFPEGGSFSYESTKNHPRKDWAREVKKALKMFESMAKPTRTPPRKAQP